MSSVLDGGAINIGGHKIPYALIAAGAGVAGAVLLVIQLRKSGGGLSTGTPVTDSSLGLSSAGGSPAAADASSSGLSDLGAQITALGQNLPAAIFAAYPSGWGPQPTYPSPAVPAYQDFPPYAVGRAPATSTISDGPGQLIGGAPTYNPTPPPAPPSIYSPGQTLNSIVAAAQRGYSLPAPVSIAALPSMNSPVSFNPVHNRTSGNQAII